MNFIVLWLRSLMGSHCSLVHWRCYFLAGYQISVLILLPEFLSLCWPSSILKASKGWWSHFHIYNLHFPFSPHVSGPAHKDFPHLRAPAFRLGPLKESKVTALCQCLIIPAKSLCHVKQQIQAFQWSWAWTSLGEKYFFMFVHVFI